MLHHNTGRQFPLPACLKELQVSRTVPEPLTEFRCCITLFGRLKPQPPHTRTGILPFLPADDGRCVRYYSSRTPNRGRCLPLLLLRLVGKPSVTLGGSRTGVRFVIIEMTYFRVLTALTSSHAWYSSINGSLAGGGKLS